MSFEKDYWIWDLILLVALAGLLRFHGLEQLPLDPAETGIGFQSILFQYFGESEWIARLPSAVCGILATTWIFLWGAQWFGPWNGSLAALLFAVCPASVYSGRVATAISLEQFLLFLFVVSAWKRIECNCLGHPLTEPPRASGRPSAVLKQALHFLPLVVLAILLVAVNSQLVPVLLLLPAYCIIRALWSWRRGGHEDHEFKRSLLYLFTSLGLIGFLWYSGESLSASSRTMEGGGYPGIIEELGWPLFVAIVAGTMMATTKGRAGWLCACGFWVPVVCAIFPFTPLSPRDAAVLVLPIAVLLAGIPLAWAVDEIKGRKISARKRYATLAKFAAVVILIVAAVAVTTEVFVREDGTAAIVRGNQESSR